MIVCLHELDILSPLSHMVVVHGCCSLGSVTKPSGDALIQLNYRYHLNQVQHFYVQ